MRTGLSTLLCTAAASLTLTVMTGCSKDSVQVNSDGGSVSKEPVTLQVFVVVPGLTDNDFKQMIEAPVKKKYPHITLQLMRPGTGSQFADLVAASTLPDLIYGAFGNNLTNFYREFHATTDLTPLAKKFGMDLSKFNPLIMEQIRTYSDGALHSLPFTLNTFGLYYNKGIFDRFGIPYPKDGLLWEDALEIARKLTRTDNGINYRGLEIYNNQSINSVASPLTMTHYDEKTGKAVVSDLWKRVFQLTMDIYSIPGNRPDKIPPGMVDQFTKSQTLAMAPTFTNGIFASLEGAQGSNLDWDVAQPPSFREAPNATFALDVHQFSISSSSKYADQAFQVLQLVMSEEAQTLSTRMGKLTALNNPEIRKLYASDVPYAKGKNMQSMLKSTPAQNPPYSRYNGLVTNAVDQGFRDVFNGKADINTALRQAEEKANKAIAEQKLAEK
jgi:multiple sugar transport system substrate-binding protein